MNTDKLEINEKRNIKAYSSKRKTEVTQNPHSNKNKIINISKRKDRIKNKSYSKEIELNPLKKNLSKAISKHLEVTIELCDNLQPYLQEHPSEFLQLWKAYLDSIARLKTKCDET
ncbi:hypothetical protein [Leptospira noguchii]|uniref:hypothetical protein n=1 Tax=Leptospira noguchii TaxID=28182 RepID=UPI00077321A1|nr:hypothetical protein [Leptospira noguchii]